MPVLDDLTLIQLFITTPRTLAANHHLRLETVGRSMQLSSSQQGLAAVRTSAKPHSPIEVRRSTPYWSLLVELLAEHGFMPIDTQATLELVRFEYQPVPADYTMHCTPARALWQSWRAAQSQIRGGQQQQQRLIFVKGAWTPVQALACSQGCVYLTTLTDEIMLQMEDRLTWLDPIDLQQEASEQTVCFTAAIPNTHEVPEIITSVPQPIAPLPTDRTTQQVVSALVLRQLRRQVGSVPERWQTHIQALSLSQLESLGEALLSFRVLVHLATWLQAQRQLQSAPGSL